VALIFDLDGVLVDSMPLHIESWRIYLKRLGKPRVELSERMHGRRNDEIVREWIGADLSDEAIVWHGAEKERLFRDMMGPAIERHLVPGIANFLQAYQGVKKAVASNAERPNIDLILDSGGLRRHFLVVLDGQQVQRPKPFPDIYKKAAELLGVAMSECVIFEDSPAGVEAGLAAGARVVGLATHLRELSGVDLMIRDFRDPALVDWMEHRAP